MIDISKATVILLHIPKCGGNTFISAIARNFNPLGLYLTRAPYEKAEAMFAELAEPSRRDVTLFAGHVGFGIHELIPKASTYITMLREPNDRLRSEYFFARCTKTHPHYEIIEKEKMSLIQYVTSDLSRHFDNCQTRMLSGRAETHWLNGRVACEEEDLQRACEHLEKSFSWIGLTERFEESTAGMCLTFGWPYSPVSSRNVTPEKLSMVELSAEEISSLRSRNLFDVRLYEHAVGLYERQIANLGEQLKTSMRARPKADVFNLTAHRIQRVIRRVFRP
jgi:hypothetical protein